MSDEWVPAFPGQRPPFQPGNKVAVGNMGANLIHGAWSPRKVDPLAREVVAMVLADPANVHASQPRHRFALWAFARAEAQVQLLTEYLAKAGEDAGNGIGDLDLDRVRTAYLLLHRAEARATTGRTRLGLDPLSAARLGRDRAATNADMARVMSELARLEASGVDVRGLVQGLDIGGDGS
ncbi:MAG: hypothetical protein ACYDDW_05290 [Dermatophilaceae bacterium]